MRERVAGWPFRAASLLGLGATLSSGGLWPEPLNLRVLDLGDAVFFAAFVWSLLCAPPRPVSRGYARASEFAAGISYTLYLVHFPLVAFLAAACFRSAAPWAVTPLTVLATFGISALTVLYAVVVWLPFERNTRRIRERIMPSARAISS